ncbi:unnamed protein product [Rangifer tarandus platyrhynchus]|uniref:Uncharacterized protein n=1 Tax=Rangifer tarandus platyrhynchus TaxID=3082113 RepID=A0AC59ZHX1_RANTA
MLSRFSHVQLFATLCTVVHQTPLSMGFSRQEYWSVLPCLPPGDLPDPGIEPTSPVAPALQADSLPLSQQGSQWYCICLLEKNIHTKEPVSSNSCSRVNCTWKNAVRESSIRCDQEITCFKPLKFFKSCLLQQLSLIILTNTMNKSNFY